MEDYWPKLGLAFAAVVIGGGMMRFAVIKGNNPWLLAAGALLSFACLLVLAFRVAGFGD